MRHIALWGHAPLYQAELDKALKLISHTGENFEMINLENIKAKFNLYHSSTNLIPESVIRRRFSAGLHNFENLYKPLVNEWVLYDNSSREPILVSEGVNS